MASSLIFTLRFLQPYCHGRRDGGEPEWPPSPFRFLQTLVSASAARWNERFQVIYAKPALEWLEKQGSPTILAGSGVSSERPYRLYVPDNFGDKVAQAWSKGRPASISEYLTDKDVRPTHLLGDTLHYLFPLRNEQCPHLETLQRAARSITHLGWGIDMVAGDAAVITSDEADKLPGHRWRETSTGGIPLRVPIRGTLDDLMRKHHDFLHRISADGFRPVPPLRAFRVARYHSATVASSGLPARPWCAFGILKPDFSRNAAFETSRRTRDVAAWLRHAVGNVCTVWPFPHSPDEFIHGHAGTNKPVKGANANMRLMYLPLPSIERRGEKGIHVGAIRRVLITAPAEGMEHLEWIRRRIQGSELLSQDQGRRELRGILNTLPRSDWVVRHYTEPATTWTSVTPVLLPGHDDHDIHKAIALLRKAFLQSGIAEEIMSHPDFDFDFRKVGFLPGVEHADRFALPEHPQVKGARYHVWLRFPYPLPGPLAIGALRYRGFGLMARQVAGGE